MMVSKKGGAFAALLSSSGRQPPSISIQSQAESRPLSHPSPASLCVSEVVARGGSGNLCLDLKALGKLPEFPRKERDLPVPPVPHATATAEVNRSGWERKNPCCLRYLIQSSL